MYILSYNFYSVFQIFSLNFPSFYKFPAFSCCFSRSFPH